MGIVSAVHRVLFDTHTKYKPQGHDPFGAVTPASGTFPKCRKVVQEV